MDQNGTDVTPPSSTLLTPITVPYKTLLGPGPSNAPPRVLSSGVLPILGHLHPEFVKIMDDCKAGIQYLFQTQNEVTLCVSGTGHAGMEMACDNMVEPGDKVLVFVSGIWGQRFAEMVSRHGGEPVLVEKLGDGFSPDEIEQALKDTRPAVAFITHGESSSSLLQPIENLGHLCHKYDCVLIVDSVAAAGGVPIFMDKWGIDVMYTGGQKCLGAPPGASPISFSPRAMARFEARKKKPVSYYMDLAELSNYWGCDKAPARRYHHTAPITTVYMMREAFAELAEEGLQASWRRHAECAQMLRDGLASLGLEIYITKPEYQLPTITGVVVPEGVDWKQVSTNLMTKHRIELSGGLGHTAGKIWRAGLMGSNARPDIVSRFLKYFGEEIKLVKSSL